MICGITNIKALLEQSDINIHLSDDIYNRIAKDAEECTSDKFHVCLLLDMSNNIISYGYNEYYKCSSYPFTTHAEVNCMSKYYAKKIKPYMKSRDKILLVMRISSKIKKLGQSKPCKKCQNYIVNNMSNANIKKIIYSTEEHFVSLKSNRLADLETIYSSGHRFNIE